MNNNAAYQINYLQSFRSRGNKYAFFGAGVALLAVIIATVAVGVVETREISLAAFVTAQSQNVSLWVLDIMPFIFAFWGQHIGMSMAVEASAMVASETRELREKTTALESKILHTVLHDSLTDLPNRVLLVDRLNQAIARAREESARLAILTLNINNFKEVNNTFGHHSGDMILKELAARLSTAISEPDTTARLGSDEFAVLMSKIMIEEDAASLAHRIHVMLNQPFDVENVALDMQINIGVTIFPEHGHNADTLLQKADIAMEVCKQNGAEFVIYSDDLGKHIPRRMAIMTGLPDAIKEDQLALSYQPKVDMQTGRILGAEASVQWEHPQYGVVSADEIIPIAEGSELIKPLARWIVDSGLDEHDIWQKAGKDIGVSVNMSGLDILDADLPEAVQERISKQDANNQALTLEITETGLITNQAKKAEVINKLAKQGVRLAVDDFGSSYASLAYLSKLDVNELKIDRIFVEKMQKNPKDKAIVKATIELAHSLGLKVIADGVDDKDLFGELKDLGCDYAQGTYVGKPMNAKEFEEWIQIPREQKQSTA